MTATLIPAGEVVTFRVGDQWFGVDVMDVQEVIGYLRIAQVPLAAPGIAGFLNLRGQIVTAIDVHQRLEISHGTSDSSMNVVVRDGDELFALVVDEVGDVATISPETLDPAPASLGGAWARVCTGVVRMDQGLLAIVDVTRLLDEPNTRP